MLTKANHICDLLTYVPKTGTQLIALQRMTDFFIQWIIQVVSVLAAKFLGCAFAHLFIYKNPYAIAFIAISLHPKCWKMLAFYSSVVANYWDAAVPKQVVAFAYLTITMPLLLYIGGCLV